MLDNIFIKGLALEAIIGIYPHERKMKQPILLDLDLFVDTHLPAKSGLITDTVDYDLVVKRIANLVAQSQCELLESLAQHIADIIFKEFRVYRLRCSLYKPKAINNAQMVGITIERVNKALMQTR
jgi:7,8-dihydroneopterin aldolase/epimerase/oxygenase